MMVDLVNVTTRDGIRLDGTWRMPSVQRASQLGVDVVIVRLCRKIAFSRQNPKTVYWKINDLRVQTFLVSVICDRAGFSPETSRSAAR